MPLPHRATASTSIGNGLIQGLDCMASKSKIAKVETHAEVFDAPGKPVANCAGDPRAVYRKFGTCPYLFPPVGGSGTDSRCEEGELVKGPRNNHDDRPHRRHVDPYPQRGARRTASCGTAGFQSEARTGRKSSSARATSGTGRKCNPPRPNQIRIHLKYGPNGERVIRHIRRVSSPGRRVYSGSTKLKPVLNGLGICIISTSRGVISDREAPAAEPRRGSPLRSLVEPAPKISPSSSLKV